LELMPMTQQATVGDEKRRRGGARKTRKPEQVELFVEHAARPGVSLAQAATAAGYSPKRASAQVTGSVLMSDPDIRARVEARRRELLEEMKAPGFLLLVYCPRVGLHRLAFAPGQSADEAFASLQAESSVRLRLLWWARGRREAPASLLAPFARRQHHGSWYKLEESDLREIVARTETCTGKGRPAL
jgi:hypothetical protein